MASPKIITIEGNIGAGKSTILEQMKQRFIDRSDILFLKEPVDIWESVRDPADGASILKKFYMDPAKYSFPFQIMAYISRLSLLCETIRLHPECKIIICERSLDADRNIFAKMLYDDGLIEPICYQIYKRVYNEFHSSFTVDKIIYIDAEPEICAERIVKRSRDGEGNIELEYLKKCKKYHDKWLLEKTDKKPNILHLITNEDAKYTEGDMEDCGNQWINAIMDFIGDC